MVAVAEEIVAAMLDDIAQEQLDADFGGLGDDGEEVDFPATFSFSLTSTKP